MKIEVARRERSTNVGNVDTFKDFILSSKHLEGREGVRESGGVGDSFTLNWFSSLVSLKPLSHCTKKIPCSPGSLWDFSGL